MPIAEIAKDGAVYLFNFKGISLNGALKENGIAISVLLVVIMILHGLAIFSYKNRKRQVQFVFFAILSILILLGVFIFFTYISFSGALISFKIGAVLPLVAVVIDLMAIRAINKDEALIRSIDRIR